MSNSFSERNSAQPIAINCNARIVRDHGPAFAKAMARRGDPPYRPSATQLRAADEDLAAAQHDACSNFKISKSDAADPQMAFVGDLAGTAVP